jgi:signal peptidase I
MSLNQPTIVKSLRFYRGPSVEPIPEGLLSKAGTNDAAVGTRWMETVRAFGLVSRSILNTFSIFVLSGVFGLAVLATAPHLLGFDAVVVGSGSMEPSLRVADVVVLADPIERQVGEGSVITYWVDDTSRIHRVVEVVPDGYRTKGDANRAPDSETVAPQAVTGIGIYVVPFIGWPHLWLTTGQWPELIAATAALVLLASTDRAGFVDRPQPRADSRLGPFTIHRRRRLVTS